MSSAGDSRQAFPPSITGEASRSAGSVLDHAFGASDPYTLGVEEEYQLLDAETFDLVQHIETMLAEVSGHELEARINAELMQSVLEISTPICRDAGDVMRWLVTLRSYVAETAHAQGLRLGSAGTHPFSLFERQRITAKDRYRALIDQLQYVARRELIFGMHVHVAVDDPEKAIQVVNGLLPQLAPLLALSASSPFWRGEPTGLASSRQMVFSAFPRSGPPPRFRDYADYAEVVGQLERTGCIADYTHIWWDIRPHPRLGTIEIRICDAVTRIEDAVAIAAYCQALVKQLCERYEAGEEIPSYHRILTSENKWLAARYGLEAPIMDLGSSRRNRIPVARLIRRTVAELRPHAHELGSERELEGVLDILAHGSSAERQLRIWNANHDIVEVAREIAIATETLPVAPSALVAEPRS
ncbi:MAG: glutamate--cysteine ligase [Thermoleophilia bacterium]|nr:glutamate--cysteine ligase [Gaiellaceae bacterium]MDW8339203.1 glutamate--cysteine ligase [Thermoleophilia bacterium]